MYVCFWIKVSNRVLKPFSSLRQNFASFCRAHPLLERLRLNKRPCEVSELYSIIDWSRLPPIRVLSLHSRIIYASDYLQNSWMRNRAERALCMLLNKCSSLEELEICPDFNESPDALIRFVIILFFNSDIYFDVVSRLGIRGKHFSQLIRFLD